MLLCKWNPEPGIDTDSLLSLVDFDLIFTSESLDNGQDG